MKRRTLLRGILASPLLTAPALQSCQKKEPRFGATIEKHESNVDYSLNFSHPLLPSLQFTPEQVYLGPNKILAGKTDDPYLIFHDVRQITSANHTRAFLQGRLHGDKRYPFALQITTQQLFPWLFEIRGAFVKLPTLPRGLKVFGFCPCFDSPLFSKQNTFPTRMGEQVFVMTRDRGFQWLADANHWLGHSRAPWYEMLPTTRHLEHKILPKSVLSKPFVGWVEKDHRLLVALWGENGYEAGSRLAPCLHNNVTLSPGPQGQPPSFRYRIYIGPADLASLRYLETPTRTSFFDGFRAQALSPVTYPVTYPVATAPPLSLSKDTLWPYTEGSTLLPMERSTLPLWRPLRSSLSLRPPSKRKWENGNRHRKPFPADVYEGKFAFHWRGKSDAKAELRCALPASSTPTAFPTHLSLYFQNRVEDSTVSLELRLERGGVVLARRNVNAYFSSSQRSLLFLGGPTSLAGAELVLRIKKSTTPDFALLVDDLRWYVSQHTLSLL